MSYIKYPILEEAYEKYQQTYEREFRVIPKNAEYIISALNTIPTLIEEGFITDVTDNLLNGSSIQLTPLEYMSFTLTSDGIEYVRSNR